jgi:hypothetical protein
MAPNAYALEIRSPAMRNAVTAWLRLALAVSHNGFAGLLLLALLKLLALSTGAPDRFSTKGPSPCP